MGFFTKSAIVNIITQNLHHVNRTVYGFFQNLLQNPLFLYQLFYAKNYSVVVLPFYVNLLFDITAIVWYNIYIIL